MSRLALPAALCLFACSASAFAEDEPWVAAMREVHAKFEGQSGTLACFGDSITDTLAFWAPLAYARNNAPLELEEALALIDAHMDKRCWREWKGGEFGNQSGQIAPWAAEHVEAWLAKLQPEVVLVMFGTNDLTRVEPAEHEAALKQVIEACLAKGTVVILSTIPPRHGQDERVADLVARQRKLAQEHRLPLLDFHAAILERRPDDWDGTLAKFGEFEGYEVPTLISRDGVHPSNPRKFAGDFSPDGLRSSGYTLRNYLAALAYGEVIRRVLK